MIRFAASAVCAAILCLASSARAGDLKEKDVQKMGEQVKQGKEFIVRAAAPAQQLVLGVGELSFVVDLKAQLCFAGVTDAKGQLQSIAPAACAALKRGYPILAPLITWEQ